MCIAKGSGWIWEGRDLQRGWVLLLGWEDPLEEVTYSSILAWRILMDRRAWWATVHGVTKSQTQLSNWAQPIRRVLICSTWELGRDWQQRDIAGVVERERLEKHSEDTIQRFYAANGNRPYVNNSKFGDKLGKRSVVWSFISDTKNLNCPWDFPSDVFNWQLNIWILCSEGQLRDTDLSVEKLNLPEWNEITQGGQRHRELTSNIY